MRIEVRNFLLGCLGGVAPEVVRLYKIATAGGPAPELSTFYWVISAIYVLVAGGFTVAFQPPERWKAVWVGASLPTLLTALIANPPAH